MGLGQNQFMPMPNQLPPGVAGPLGQPPVSGSQAPVEGGKGGGGGIFGGKGGEGGETPQPQIEQQPPAPIQFSAYQSPEEMAIGRQRFKAMEKGTPGRADLKQEFQGRRRETRAGSPFQDPRREAVRQMEPGADKRQARKDFRQTRRAERGQVPRPGLA